MKKDSHYELSINDVNQLLHELAILNPEDKRKKFKNWQNFFMVQAIALLIPDEFEGRLCESGALKPYNIPQCRWYVDLEKEILHVFFYKRSFIHIPKTGGMHMITKYRNHQVGGNHMYANKNFPNFDDYCLFFDQCFTIVRNPFSWLFSFYHHSDGDKKVGHSHCRLVKENDSFESFVYNICDLDEYTQWFPFPDGMTTQIFDENDNICAKEIVFFERYEDGVSDLDFKENADILINSYTEQEKKYLYFKKSEDGYKNHYTDKMIDAVSEKFSFDLSFLGYDFNGLTHEKVSMSLPRQMGRHELLKYVSV